MLQEVSANFDWKEIRNAIIIAGVSALITFAFSYVQTAFFSPQFNIQYESWMTSACPKGETEWSFAEKCSDDKEKIPIYIEKITLTNTGNKQAKNVDMSIISRESLVLTVNECPEANIQLTDEEKITKFEFKRLSTNIPCYLEFSNIHGHLISKMIVTGDDVQGYQWDSGKIIQYDAAGFLIFLIFYVTAITGTLGYVVIQFIKLINISIKRKKLKIPSKIKSYYCEFRIEEAEGKNPADAEKKVIELRNNWLQKIRTLSKTPPIQVSAEEEILNLKEGTVHIFLSSITVQSRNTLFRAANFRIRSEKRSAIEKLLKSGKVPCWTIFWEFYTQFDVQFAVNVIKEKFGKTPGSSASMTVGEETKLTDADFNLINLENATLRISLSQGTEKTGGRVGLIFDGSENQGFFELHKTIGIRTILFMLYGELSLSKFLKIIEKMIKKT